jgi:hypothetical protein
MNPGSIPKELLDQPNWVRWWHTSDGKKMFQGRSNDRSTWHTIDDLATSESVAFVIPEAGQYVGVDLDDVIEPDGSISEQAKEVLRRFEGVSYAEISPSGSGIKLITRGQKPDWGKCEFETWLECYDHNRFWCMTGKAVGNEWMTIGDGQEAIDWLADKYLRPKQQAPKRKAMPVEFCTGFSSKWLTDRANAYAAAYPLVAEGGRNNAAFRLAGHLYAIDHHGERLRQSECFDLVWSWNCRLTNPLDEAEVRSVVESSYKNGTPMEIKPAGVTEDLPEIDWEAFCSIPTEQEADEQTKEEFCESMIPSSGILREVYEYYSANAVKHSPVFGLAGAVSFLEAITGRKIESHTGLRTNDYNLILAPTGSGKEAFQSAIGRLLIEANYECIMVPEAVQSGNGLLGWMTSNPLSYWVSDEFGKYLQAVLDKRGNKHLKDVGSLLLSLYSKSGGYYSGAAHSAGSKNRIEQPHLTILASSTATTVFDAVDETAVHDGLLGRVAFWVVEDRPKRRKMRKTEPSQSLVDQVRDWLHWCPGAGDMPDAPPVPEMLLMTDDAMQRWEHHAEEIDQKHEAESEAKAAIWARVAARSMKLSMVSVASRLGVNPSTVWWPSIRIDLNDIEWGIRLSNWLARAACEAITARIPDKQSNRAYAILASLEDGVEVRARDIARKYGVSSGDLAEAAKMLNLEKIEKKMPKGKPAVYYKRGRNPPE